MKPDDYDKFSEALKGLSEVFDKQLSPAAIVLYFDAMMDLSLDAVTAATKRYILNGKFFPKIAEIRELCAGSTEDQVQNAWNLLNKAYRKAGEMDSVCFQDPAMAYALTKTFTTWTNCANELYTLSPEMLAFKKKEFGKNYKLYAIEQPDSQPLYFPGKAESSNRQSAGKWMIKIDSFKQPVHLVGPADVDTVNLNFDGGTGLLTEASAKRLYAFQTGIREIKAGNVQAQIVETIQ